MTNFNEGDQVTVTLEGLQEHSRSIPAQAGYSSETLRWRRLLSGFRDKEEVGTVHFVQGRGKDLTVKWNSVSYLVGVPSYMVKKVK